MLFKDIPGLTEIKKILIGTVANKHIAHAQLFFGPEGSGALPLAIAYATYINCEERNADDACGRCASCIKYQKLIHPDLHFVYPVSTTKEKTKDVLSKTFMPEWRQFITDNPYANLQDWAAFFGGENKQLNISVEESRNIIRTLTLKSFEAEYKVLILWMPENMNTSSANALLKMLEEPPAKTLFFLITTDPGKIITTILSRTQMAKVRPFNNEEIISELKKQKNIDDKSAEHLAYLADGNLNQALRLSSEINEEHHGMFREWMRTCYKKDIAGLVNWSENFHKNGRESQRSLLQYGLNIMRDTLINKHAGEDLLRLQDEDKKFVDNFSKILDERKIELISNEMNNAYYQIERNANAKILFLDLSLTLSALLR